MPYLPWVMSKFLNMGYSLAEEIAMATSAPARIISRNPKHGTLQAGAPADLSIMELVEAPVSFVDTSTGSLCKALHSDPELPVVILGAGDRFTQQTDTRRIREAISEIGDR